MPDILSLLEALGAWSLPYVWLPVGIWTTTTLFVLVILRFARRAHPLVPHLVRQALIAALPLALAAGIVLSPLMPPILSASHTEDLTPTAQVSMAQRTAEASIPAIFQAEPLMGAVHESSPMPLGMRLAGFALLLVIGVALLGLLRLALMIRALQNFRRQLTPAADLRAAVEDRRHTWTLPRKIKTAWTSERTTPFTFGWRHPVIVIPEELKNKKEALALALDHELAHIHRRDFAMRTLDHVLVAVFGWHPLVWLLSRTLDEGREQLCDAEVLARRSHHRRAYADLLLSFAALPTPTLALSAASPTSFLSNRLAAMKTKSLAPTRIATLRRTGLALGAIVFSIVILASGMGAAVASPDAPIAPNPLDFATQNPPPVQDFHLVNPRIEVDGTLVEQSAVELTASSFVYFFIEIPGQGRYIISADPFDGASEAGSFEGRQLSFVVDGHRVVVLSETPILGHNRAIPAYALLDSDAPTNGVALGVTRDYEQIPALDIGLFPDPRPSEAVRDTIIYEVVEEMPSIVGGLESIQNEIRYPNMARQAGIEGRVFVQFVVDEEGYVEDAVVMRGLGSGLDAEALRAVSQARFTPGRHRGEAVKVRMTLPVTFRIDQYGGEVNSRPARELLDNWRFRELMRRRDPTPEQIDGQLAEFEAAVRAELTQAHAEADSLQEQAGDAPTPDHRTEFVRLQTRTMLLEQRYRQIVEERERIRLGRMEAEILGRDN
ncbi:MAG: M56 family metallopeptidase [Bacteroidetes bacterium]|nr:M56 family metallopeptidase [Bacteroidota bacterium]